MLYTTQNGITGDNCGLGLDALNTYAPGHVFHTNVIERPPDIPYPEGQTFVPAQTCASQGYWDYTNGVFVGPYPMGSDGKVVGCDLEKIRSLQPWAGL